MHDSLPFPSLVVRSGWWRSAPYAAAARVSAVCAACSSHSSQNSSAQSNTHSTGHNIYESVI